MIRKHPADGRFYLTVNRLRDFHPCSGGLQAFIDGASHIHGSVADDQKIPVTIDLLDKVFAHSVVGGFVVDVLVEGRAISYEQADHYWEWNHRIDAAERFMAVIAQLPATHHGVSA